MNELTAAMTEEENPLSEQRLNNALDGLEYYYYDHLKNRMSKSNALTIADYILTMIVETNLTTNHKRGVVTSLKLLSQFLDNKPFKEMIKEDILAFLDSIRRPETKDPTHKWIGTYNQRIINLQRFFKWLYSPDIEPSKRQKPKVIENIPTLKRKEKSKYKASDMWTKQEQVIFLQYCGNKRDRCYHAMAIDTGCRPNELLKLRIKDIVFKTAENSTQYAEIQVNGKTGNRTIPLIVCIPYVKDWIDDHPQRSNPHAYLFCGLKKNFGRALTRSTLYNTYVLHYKEEAFPRLLQDTNVPTADKVVIKDLLKKPWNPYIQRHNSMTEKAKILKESLLRIHAGWTPNSKMPQTYLHYFGNESSETLLEAAGIITKDKKVDPLKPKQCPNCSEPNKPDSRFCANCRYILTYDAYDETLQGQKEKDDRLFTLENQVKSLVSALGNMEGQHKNEFAKALFVGGLFKKE
jgi:integrase/recombinase XerD